jgi:hypothetical protein
MDEISIGKLINGIKNNLGRRIDDQYWSKLKKQKFQVQCAVNYNRIPYCFRQIENTGL